jgi:hypothetical protein
MSFLEAMRTAALDFREISKIKAVLTSTEQRLADMCSAVCSRASCSRQHR